jgi:hypothetical protein
MRTQSDPIFQDGPFPNHHMGAELDACTQPGSAMKMTERAQAAAQLDPDLGIHHGEGGKLKVRRQLC